MFSGIILIVFKFGLIIGFMVFEQLRVFWRQIYILKKGERKFLEKVVWCSISNIDFRVKILDLNLYFNIFWLCGFGYILQVFGVFIFVIKMQILYLESWVEFFKM